MDYREYEPSAALAPFLDCLWTLEAAADVSAVPQPLLPDGRPELVVHFGDAFERIHAAGLVVRQPAIILAGQLSEQIVLRPTGRIAVLGLRFRPDGLSALVGPPQDELVGLTIGVEAVSPPLSRLLRRVRESAASLADAVAQVRRDLRGVLEPHRVDARVRYAVTAIRHRRGGVSVDDLARDAGMTRRHLERRFRQAVGIPPKRLARITRFQHALQMLERLDSPRRGTTTAAECGYADQSHFVREFRELAG